MRPLARFPALVGGLLLLVLAGCADDGIGKRYPVSGTITYNGEPVPHGNIFFVPDDPNTGRAATGTIENGRYRLSTAGKNDGALPGSYKIRIVAKEIDTSQVLANAGGGAGRQDDIIAANQSAKLLIPAKYELETTSGLTATVEEKSNTIDFALTD
ncbi:hypothetical protein [Tautonia sociabilis]|uniref:Carboxypeptidase regulatory-like domain-containing protein n=1 Tax=Tautonia sociabilis TaxID=2080755 RepID=A0A432MDZ1_9BACT|nr:hypothetical protein [Tautonia sociabilis]RUL83321.1 hypothetical protein TsocGM_22495 [Tautonia sociabilis]